MPTDNKTLQWYNDNAQHYAAHSRNENHTVFHSLYDKPAIENLLPELTGKRALVLGCGPGDDVAYLKSKGAAEAIGIDSSERLIGIAQHDHPDSDFRIMDIEHLDFPDNSFDFAYAGMVMHYLEDWTSAMKEIFRILKPDSSFVFSIGHPTSSAMTVTEDTDTVKKKTLSEITNKETDSVEIIGDYFTRRILPADAKMDVSIWHKSLTEIVAECTSAGFVISALVEPQPLDGMKEMNLRRYTSLAKIPGVLVLKLEKRS